MRKKNVLFYLVILSFLSFDGFASTTKTKKGRKIANQNGAEKPLIDTEKCIRNLKSLSEIEKCQSNLDPRLSKKSKLKIVGWIYRNLGKFQILPACPEMDAISIIMENSDLYPICLRLPNENDNLYLVKIAKGKQDQFYIFDLKLL